MRIATHSLAILSTFLCIETVSAQSAKLSAETDCRAGCQGNKSGCQESGQAAIIAADKGMRLYKESLTISRIWRGGDTTPLATDPQWEIKFVPNNDPRPVSVTIKPILNTCVGLDAHKQSRTHYEWTAIQGSP